MTIRTYHLNTADVPNCICAACFEIDDRTQTANIMAVIGAASMINERGCSLEVAREHYRMLVNDRHWTVPSRANQRSSRQIWDGTR